jgi:predicted nuclease of predicted toxin-antitoxin system
MNFLADEGIDKPVVDRLRYDGHQVIYIAEEAPGLDDETILAMANHAMALLLTRDKDFGELVYRMQRVTHSVLLMRLDGITLEVKASTISAAVTTHGAEMLLRQCGLPDHPEW